jgi:hypothetical protein
VLGVGPRVPQRAERVKGHHPGLSVPRSGSLQAPSTLQTLSRPQPPGGRRFATITLSRMRLSRYRSVETRGPTLYPAGQSLGKRPGPNRHGGCAPTTEVYLGDETGLSGMGSPE